MKLASVTRTEYRSGMSPAKLKSAALVGQGFLDDALLAVEEEDSGAHLGNAHSVGNYTGDCTRELQRE